VLPPDTRRLVLVFDAPVARELRALAERLSWPVTLLEPQDGGSLAAAALDVLAGVLAGPTRWVGVMGSLRHTAPHVEALRSRGVPEADIARVHRPIGLDIGSHTPPEIAVATIAGLLADRNGRPGGPFT
jgi:xanthine dehydrogenase accessory factor